MVKAIVGTVCLAAGALAPGLVLADRGDDRGRDDGRNPLENVAVTGAGSGHALAGRLEIHRFEAVNGSVLAVGVLRGTLRDGGGNATRFEEEAVAIPVATGGAGTQGVRSTRSVGGLRALVIPAQAARCQILNLDLAPVNLNLLGLTIDTTVIQLVINANQGAGNLLGNLLCAVAGLLDGFTPPRAPALAAALNDTMAAL